LTALKLFKLLNLSPQTFYHQNTYLLCKDQFAIMGSIEEPIVELDVLLVGAGFGSFALMNR
jgi:hypothetical protein